MMQNVTIRVNQEDWATGAVKGYKTIGNVMNFKRFI